MEILHLPARRDAGEVKVPAKHAHINGWGADLDHAMRPAYPMERTPPRLEGAHTHPPAQQPQTVEILQSIERPSMTPLFGTPNPPSGLSGMVRRVAFKYSESDLRHWLLLLFADRVNMVEGLGEDLMHGKIPKSLPGWGSSPSSNTTAKPPCARLSSPRRSPGSACCCGRHIDANQSSGV